MRTIKYRAWDLLNKKMISDFRIEFRRQILIDPYKTCYMSGDDEMGGYGDDSYRKTCDGYPIKVSPTYKLMQFTGLIDKNGVGIFEGDIVKCGYFTDFDTKSKRKWHDFVGVIECENLGWLTCGKINWNELNTSGAQVIGNVFSNPELLKGEGAENG